MLREYKKALTSTITSLIQYGTGNMVHTNKEKTEVGRKKCEPKLDPGGYLWSHVHKVNQSHTSKTFTTMRESNQETATKNNTMVDNTSNVGWKPSE